MATMNVSLPDPMKAWVEAQAQTGRYSNASDYVRDLIRRDQEQADRLAALQRYLDEAEASGTSSRSVKKIVAEARAIARERGLPERQGTGSPGRLTGIWAKSISTPPSSSAYAKPTNTPTNLNTSSTC